MDNLKYRSQQQQNNDEVIRYNERYEERVRTTDKTAPKERVSELYLHQTRSLRRSTVNHFLSKLSFSPEIDHSTETI